MQTRKRKARGGFTHWGTGVYKQEKEKPKGGLHPGTYTDKEKKTIRGAYSEGQTFEPHVYYEKRVCFKFNSR